MSVGPLLSSDDPSGASEGILDLLGLYQIADQLATRLVPAVRERMRRVRFLTSMAVAALATERLEGERGQPTQDLPHSSGLQASWGQSFPGAEVLNPAARSRGTNPNSPYLV